MSKIKDIAVIGAGGVGGFFAGKIINSRKYRVSLIARGEHLRAIQNDGLILNTAEKREIICKPYIATDSFDKIPAPDLAFITVKGYDLEGVTRLMSKTLSETSILLPLLNGVDIYERIKRLIPWVTVLPGCVYVSSHIEKPGVVTQTGGKGMIILGKDPKKKEFDPTEIKRVFQDARIPYQWEENPFPAIWTKFVFIASFALVSAYSGKTIGEILEEKGLNQLVYSIGSEIVEIAKKKGIMLKDNVVKEAIIKAHSFPYDTKTSYQRDLETPGKPNEGELFGGTIIRMGKELGVNVSTTEKIYTTILNR